MGIEKKKVQGYKDLLVWQKGISWLNKSTE